MFESQSNHHGQCRFTHSGNDFWPSRFRKCHVFDYLGLTNGLCLRLGRYQRSDRTHRVRLSYLYLSKYRDVVFHVPIFL